MANSSPRPAQAFVPIMRFTLTYEGRLPSSGNKPKLSHVWEIRRHFHPQIEELFDEHPVLSEQVPQGEYFPPISVKGFEFIPLVRRHLHMICSISVTFLRKGDPGTIVYQGGDIDNRLKTLFDGLRMPDKGDEVPEHFVTNQPMYALLESDALITGVAVKTDRL
ncbi:MAG: hypothetical protein IT537_21640, partial [Hyphomicrobiales bacterium]|nr:hypothetical protein [Hyphomicrobiales bacterium]